MNASNTSFSITILRGRIGVLLKGVKEGQILQNEMRKKVVCNHQL